MPVQKLRPSFTFDQDRLNELRTVVPEAFADGKVNWDVLREALGDHLEDADEEIERFGLFWPGKREARRLASVPSQGTLVPEPGLGVSEDTTQNIFIEGENLEVLKLLQKSYAGRVKMIYIDPPYNTGNDFIYPDDYSEPLQSYLERTGQAGEGGQLLTSNTRASGRFHSKWLTMVYPRLLLARRLLRKDGVIFVSIDDNEINHLRTLMNEVYGEENFVETLVWKKRATPPNDRIIGRIHEYILAYRKTEDLHLELLPRPQRLIDAYRNPDDDPRGPWAANDLSASGKGGRLVKSLVYPITDPETGQRHYPPEGKCWLYNRQKVQQYLEEGRIGFRKTTGTPFLKRYISEVRPGVTCPTILDDCGFSLDSSREIEEVFGKRGVYEFPKPLDLMDRLLRVGTTTDGCDVVLDFFAGSATTAHATLQLNREDRGNRRFVMVELPEPTDESGLPTTAHIGRERIRRVVTEMQAEGKGQLALHPNEDLGFKCYRLDGSNYKPWQDVATDDVTQIEMAFDRFETPLVEGWERSDLLTEILLLEGFPLDSEITSQQQFAANQVDLVTSDFHDHRLLVCVDDTLAPDTISELNLADKDVFVCLDAALTDQAKVRLSDTANVHVI